MSKYTTDKWVVIAITNPHGDIIHKVLASWYGGYTGSDSYQLSSGITDVKESDDEYEFTNQSGSVYICHKKCYGMSNYTASIHSGFTERIPPGYSVSILTESEVQSL